ncbi:MAG: cytochrome c [Acidobacteria bacterium]|nr:cytochrome c [Acidobacteriota bacterium]
MTRRHGGADRFSMRPHVTLPRVLLALALSTVISETLLAQRPAPGAEMFQAWCAQCHGSDGSGRVAEPTVKTTPMDFTDCRTSTPEPDADWELVIARGGPAAGLSSEMPEFGEVLTPAEIAALVRHLRTFCKENGWPHGNLNFPRPLFTEKAFPENEIVILPAISHRAGERVRSRMRAVFERRLGRRAHGEIGVPLESIDWPTGRIVGVGDVTIAGKYVLHDDPVAGRIFSGGLEIGFPTGSTTWRFGEGTMVVEPYFAAGTAWRDLYLQGQIAMEVAADPIEHEEGRAELVYNLYLGRDLARVPNTWTVGVEFNGSINRADRFLAVTPQLRKGLTRTGALAAAAGVRIPITDRQRQFVRWVGYLLWEYLEPVRSRK